MTEAEHVVAVAARAREQRRQELIEGLARTRRDEAIRLALAQGVSDKAVAIAAMLTLARIRQIRNFRTSTYIADVLIPLGVHAVNAHYPCCHAEARFRADEIMDPGESMAKSCPRCGKLWIVTRKVLAATDRGRVDELQWATSA